MDQESSEKITDVIFAGMPRFLQQEVDKRSADMDAIVDRTRAQIEKELTPQQDHSGVYLSVARTEDKQ
jgi:hypothetical protein